MECVNRHGNVEFESVVCVHMNGDMNGDLNGDGVICGECEGNESFGCFGSFRYGNNVSERGVVHTDGLVAQ